MKVLWICNMPLPGACKAFSIESGVGGGWLYEEARRLISGGEIELFVCFANRRSKKIKKAFDGEMTHYSIPRLLPNLFAYDFTMNKYFDEIIKDIKPDFVHIHGTENAVGLSAMRSHPELTYIVSLQGVLNYICMHECDGIPFWAHWSFGLATLIMQKGAGALHRRHIGGSKNEQKIVQGAKYVLGRTNYDYAFAQSVNINAKYIKNNRFLRESFYSKKWNSERLKNHTILIGNSAMPLKGVHYLFQAMPELIKRIPDIKVRIIGTESNICNIKDWLNISGYQLYLKRLIKHFNFKKHITFTGNLSAEELCVEMQNTSLFVLASNADNSPNMLGEAMILGVPCVASFVGGVPDMIVHRESGLLYQHDAPYMLASGIIEVLNDATFANKLSRGGKERAQEIYSPKNKEQLRNFYLWLLHEDIE